jgi:hypothetical protein
MAHFAEVIDGVVERVIVADSKEWCENTLGGTWVQTSYNTLGNVHVLGGTPLHKNYAGIGYTFDGVGFAAPQPYPSWNLNQETYLWESPVTRPADGYHVWNEENLAWEEVILPTE